MKKILLLLSFLLCQPSLADAVRKSEVSGTKLNTQIRGGEGSDLTTTHEGDILTTITWTGTTPPSGTITKIYRWTKVGKMVTVEFRYEASSAGTALTAAAFNLPPDVPEPAYLGNQSAAEWIVVGTGAVQPSAGFTISGGAGLYKQASLPAQVNIYSASSAARFFFASFTYIVD